jgi:hypothetical protein
MVTVWIDVKVPPLGEMTGVAGMMVKTAEATVLGVRLAEVAKALMVSVCETVIAAVYCVELVDGVDPSVV